MRFVFLVFAVVMGFGQPADTYVSATVKIAMRDGVPLSTNVFRPKMQARVPTILVRTPYDKGKTLSAGYKLFVGNGYAVVVQDVRGRYESEGVFQSLTQEPADGEDTVEWIAKQSWSDGQVGMIGGSYVGIVQWKLALLNNPHLKAIFPVVSGNDDYRDRFYSRGGALKLGSRLLWMNGNLKAPRATPPDFATYVRTLPLRVADVAATGQISKLYYQLAMEHPAFDAFWKEHSVREHLDRMKIPVYSIGGWYDNFAEGDLESFSKLRKAGKMAYTAIGPWPHNMSTPFEDVDFGAASKFPVSRVQLDWFNHWMKTPNQKKVFPDAPLKIFVMGRNQWREEQEWPLRRAKLTPFYLSSKKGANSLSGDGKLTLRRPLIDHKDYFDYDPANPVPTAGGAVCCTPQIFPWGPKDQGSVERRKDVLVYTSDVMVRDVEVTGPVRVVLFAATSAVDTDFTAKLVDVGADGKSRILSDGILRLRYRKSLEKAELAKPGEVYKLEIEAGVTSNVFLKGHRIRLEISSSNFPRFDRNLNTGGPIATETRWIVAHQTVHHGRKSASYVLLPIVPDMVLRAGSLTKKPSVH